MRVADRVRSRGRKRRVVSAGSWRARFGDHRGYFSEVFKEGWFRENVADVGFVQDNQSLSREVGTLRGLEGETVLLETERGMVSLEMNNIAKARLTL